MKRSRKLRRLAGKYLRRIAIVLAIVIAVPVVLSVAYTVINPPVTTMMVWRGADGNRFRDWAWRPLSGISPNLVAAVVAAEDGQFCRHWGVDWAQLHKVAVEARDGHGGKVRGASTISMQVVKNLFLWPSRSYIRKAIEVPLALWLDLVLSKRRMLEIYLNVAEWAPGVYGAEAAARHHFKVGVERLPARHSALLAATLPAPSVRNPGRPGPKLRALAVTYQKRMKTIGPYLDCVQGS